MVMKVNNLELASADHLDLTEKLETKVKKRKKEIADLRRETENIKGV